MAKFTIAFVVLTLAALSSSSKCNLKEKSIKKSIKNYKQCLKKGFTSSIGCISDEGKLGKKLQKKCKKIEEQLKNLCDYSCPINGGWSDYSNWTPCSVECGGGNQTRNRSCTNPAPQFGGVDCVGEAEEFQECNKNPCPINGGWNTWGNWSKCSVECGGGNQTRNRSCTNPAPQFGGVDCAGDAEESQECNTRSCLGNDFI